MEYKTVQGLEPSREVIGRDEVIGVRPQLLVIVVMETLGDCFLDRTLHPLDLPVGSGMIGLCQAMLDPVGFADHVETHGT